MPEASEQSLIQILQSRIDTLFKGNSVSDQDVPGDIYQDEAGNYFVHRHDYISTKQVDGKSVGILVADTDGKNCNVSHSCSGLPHLMGLYVREDYRSEGIATELVHEFMAKVDADRCIVDCANDVVPFYEQLDYEVIYAKPTRVPDDLVEDPAESMDTSPSPIHGVPFIETHDSRIEYVKKCNEADEPALLIRQINLDKWCYITIQMPYLEHPEGRKEPLCLTQEGIEKVNEVLAGYEDEVRKSGFGTMGALAASNSDFISFPHMKPDAARELADELYPLVTDQSNLEMWSESR